MVKKLTLIGKKVSLRPFQLSDATHVQRLAGDRAVADTTLNIPHPYEAGMAEDWIRGLAPQMNRGELAAFAVIKIETGELVGAVSLRIDREFDRAALGYWIGRPFWGLGYCTEAASLVIRYGFETLELNRIYSMHLLRNPASGRVMQKLGMCREGQQRQHTKKWGKYEDLVLYGLLRESWLAVH